MDRYYDSDQNELFASAPIVNPNSKLNPNKQIKVRFDSLLIKLLICVFRKIVTTESKPVSSGFEICPHLSAPHH